MKMCIVSMAACDGPEKWWLLKYAFLAAEDPPLRWGCWKYRRAGEKQLNPAVLELVETLGPFP